MAQTIPFGMTYPLVRAAAHVQTSMIKEAIDEAFKENMKGMQQGPQGTSEEDQATIDRLTVERREALERAEKALEDLNECRKNSNRSGAEIEQCKDRLNNALEGLKKCEDDAEVTQNTIKDLDRKIASLVEERDLCLKRSEDLEAESNGKSATIETLSSQIMSLEEQVEALREEREKVVREMHAQQQENAKNIQRLEEAEAYSNNSKEKIQRLSNDLQKLRETVRGFEDSKAANQSAREELQKELKKCNEALHTKDARWNSRYDLLGNKKKAVEKSLQEAEAKAELAETQRVRMESNIRKLTSELEGLRDTQRRVEDEKKSLRDDVADRETIVNRLREEISTHGDNIQRLKNRLQSAQDSLKDKTKELDACSQQRERLRAQLATCENEKKSLQDEHKKLEENLRAQLKSKTEELERVTGERDADRSRHEQEVGTLREEIAECKRQQHACNQLQEKLSQELEETKARLVQAEGQRGADNEKVESLEGQISTLRVKLAECKRLRNELSKELEEKKAELGKKEKELDAVTTSLTEKVTELGEEIKRLKKELESASIDPKKLDFGGGGGDGAGGGAGAGGRGRGNGGGRGGGGGGGPQTRGQKAAATAAAGGQVADVPVDDEDYEKYKTKLENFRPSSGQQPSTANVRKKVGHRLPQKGNGQVDTEHIYKVLTDDSTVKQLRIKIPARRDQAIPLEKTEVYQRFKVVWKRFLDEEKPRKQGQQELAVNLFQIMLYYEGLEYFDTAYNVRITLEKHTDGLKFTPPRTKSKRRSASNLSDLFIWL